MPGTAIRRRIGAAEFIAVLFLCVVFTFTAMLLRAGACEEQRDALAPGAGALVPSDTTGSPSQGDSTGPGGAVEEWVRQHQIATLDVGGLTYPIYPQKPGHPIVEAGPWYYPVPIRLDPARTCFDAATSTLHLAFTSQVPQGALDAAAGAIRDAYGASAGSGAIAMVRMVLRGFSVVLSSPGLQDLTVQDKLPAAGQTVAELPVLTLQDPWVFTFPVGDPDYQERLKSNPQSVTVGFAGLYSWQGVLTQTFQTSLVQAVLTRSLEEVLPSPDGPPKDGDFIDRLAEQRIKTRLSTLFTLTLRNASPELSARADKLLEKLVRSFYEDPRELLNQASSGFLWTTELGRRDIGPSFFDSSIRAFESWDSFEEAYKEFWDRQQATAKTTQTAQEWHAAVRAQVGTGLSVDVLGLLDVKDAHLNLAWDQLDAGARSEVNAFYLRLKNTGYVDTRHKRRQWQKWTGQVDDKGWHAKKLRLARVLRAEASQELLAQVIQEDVQWTGTQRVESLFSLPAPGPDGDDEDLIPEPKGLTIQFTTKGPSPPQLGSVGQIDHGFDLEGKLDGTRSNLDGRTFAASVKISGKISVDGTRGFEWAGTLPALPTSSPVVGQLADYKVTKVDVVGGELEGEAQINKDLVCPMRATTYQITNVTHQGDTFRFSSTSGAWLCKPHDFHQKAPGQVYNLRGSGFTVTVTYDLTVWRKKKKSAAPCG